MSPSFAARNAMPIIVHFSDNPVYVAVVKRFIRDSTKGKWQVETINTSDPETAIASFQGTEPVPIVLIDHPRNAANSIQQLQAHPNFTDSIILIITGRPQAYQTLTSATIMIGDKMDHLRMLSAAIEYYSTIS